ncbi:hypothetical protein DID73_02555 [Candidatus Marinamargulisbacteria bacterium SCGC AG-343-K17]|nr:hypothetical protein DID73_02555 [Candidatus Marinamargulisbacteria bacterium SCGC AG-343-K17]
MTKKNIKFSKMKFIQLINQVINLNEVSIIHYVNEDNHRHTLIAHSPHQTIHQTNPNENPTVTLQQSLKKNDTIWVIATSYEWGCNQLGLPTPHTNAVFIEYNNYLIFNHHTELATQTGMPLPERNHFESTPPSIPSLSPLWNESDFSNAISSAQHAIKEGDIYQINLSYPATIQTNHSIQDLYQHTQSLNQSRHGALIQTNHWGIASASPEELFYLKNGRIRTRPIKGTIGRHDDPIDDQLALNTLKNSTKDHAELVMITDLMRNDLSQFSETGSVQTTKLCDLVAFPYVYHLVSTVEAIVPTTTSPLDILKKLAPGGSITGCPKISACKQISGIEHHPREFYTGHIGFISSTGEASFNVAIRTCYQLNQNPIMTHAGCGITIDSNPIQEYQESIDKFRFLTNKVIVNA